MSRLAPGTFLSPRFQLVRCLGSGGMGEVWLAKDHELGERVALKTLRTELGANPELMELLKTECRNARRLVHPNIVRVHDFHRIESQAFLSMQYIEGTDLRKARGSPFDEIVELLTPVTEALEYAHGLGVVHRDLKTTNILRDGRNTPMITDFGIAAVAGNDPARIPASGGSLYSMSPQQMRAEPAHPSDDIYALGVVLYELLSGCPPFYPDIDPHKVEHEDPDPLRSTYPIPDELDTLVRAMLAKKREDRPRDMGAVREALSRLNLHRAQHTEALNRPVEVVPPATPPQPVAKASPVLAQPPSPVATNHGSPSLVIRGVLVSVLLLLVAVAAGVFLYLPQAVQEGRVQFVSEEDWQDSAEPALPTASAFPPVVASSSENDAQREAVEDALALFLRENERLRDLNAPSWGGNDYSAALNLAAQGDAAFSSRDLVQARQLYANGVELLEELADRHERWLQDALTEGSQALKDGEFRIALGQFQRALELAPENEAAAQGVKAGQQLQQAHQLLQSGRNSENDGRFEEAETKYQEALQLVPEFEPAKQGLSRIHARIRDRKFQLAMSKGLAALAENDFRLAQQELEKARALKTESPEARDALAQLAQSRQHIKLTRLRNEARELERKERWQEAAELYQSALEINPNLEFARNGKVQALRRARIDAQMADYLRDPLRLSAPKVHRQALAFLKETTTISEPGPRLSEQRQALEAQLTAAAKTVPVALVSDNLTEVVVYRVARLGQFHSRTLELRPGRYTIVGTREGYRDVRRSITVAAGSEQEPIVVRCEERI